MFQPVGRGFGKEQGTGSEPQKSSEVETVKKIFVKDNFRLGEKVEHGLMGNAVSRVDGKMLTQGVEQVGPLGAVW